MRESECSFCLDHDFPSQSAVYSAGLGVHERHRRRLDAIPWHVDLTGTGGEDESNADGDADVVEVVMMLAMVVDAAARRV